MHLFDFNRGIQHARDQRTRDGSLVRRRLHVAEQLTPPVCMPETSHPRAAGEQRVPVQTDLSAFLLRRRGKLRLRARTRNSGLLILACGEGLKTGATLRRDWTDVSPSHGLATARDDKGRRRVDGVVGGRWRGFLALRRL